jgi:hypothetical protein
LNVLNFQPARVPRKLSLAHPAGLTDQGLNALEAGVVRQIGAFADRLVLEINPAAQACRRLGLSANYLYVHNNVLLLRR